MRGTLLALAVVASACAVGTESTTTTVTATAAPATTSTTRPTTTTAVPVVVPDLVQGGITTAQTDLSDGTPLFYSVIVPDDFDVSQEYPVFLAMPPGGQDAGLTHNVTEGWYLQEAVARGWVVVSPAAPEGVLWFQGSEQYIEEFLDDVLGWLQPEDGRYHLGGVSNGGLSAFRVLSMVPERIASVTVFPGYALAEDVAALELVGDIPFTMWVGGGDAPWIAPSQETHATLRSLGKSATLEIIPGAPHVIPELTDGVEIFDALEAARNG